MSKIQRIETCLARVPLDNVTSFATRTVAARDYVTLVPFSPTSAADVSAFETAYRQRLRTAYPKRPDGRTLLPFRRLFLIARS